jgi:hypothetical protein
MFRNTIRISLTLIVAAVAAGAPPGPASLSGSVNAINGTTISVGGVALDTSGASILTPLGVAASRRSRSGTTSRSTSFHQEL